MRTGAFEETVRGKAVAEDAHDCFKVPLYIANESGSRPRQVSEHCACFHAKQAVNICSLLKVCTGQNQVNGKFLMQLNATAEAADAKKKM